MKTANNELEICKKWHRAMWDYIANEEEKGTCLIRSALKSDFIRQHQEELVKDGYAPNAIYNNCFACELAVRSCDAYNGIDYCQYCPIKWGSEGETDKFFCERKVDDEYIDWMTSAAEIVRDVKFWDEIEKSEEE